MNARTVLKVSSLDARAAEEEVEEEEPVLCLKIPDEEEVVFEIEQKEIRKEDDDEEREEEERSTSAMFARRCLRVHHVWPYTCVLTRTRSRTSVMCARSVSLNLVI